MRIAGKDKFSISQKFESEIIDSEDIERISIGLIEMDLESELLAEITKYVF